jgi:hypothetical protein
MFEHDDQLFFLFCDPFCWLLVRVRGCLFSMDEHNVRGFALTWRDMFKLLMNFQFVVFFILLARCHVFFRVLPPEKEVDCTFVKRSLRF